MMRDDERLLLRNATEIAETEYRHSPTTWSLTRRVSSRLERLGGSAEEMAAALLYPLGPAVPPSVKERLTSNRTWMTAARLHGMTSSPYRPLMETDRRSNREFMKSRRAVQDQMGWDVQLSGTAGVLLGHFAVLIEKVRMASGEELVNIAKETRLRAAPLAERLGREDIATLMRTEVFERMHPDAVRSAEGEICGQTRFPSRQNAEDYLHGVRSGMEHHLRGVVGGAESKLEVRCRVKAAYSYHLKSAEERARDRSDLLGLLIDLGTDDPDDLIRVIAELVGIDRWMNMTWRESHRTFRKGLYSGVNVHLVDFNGRDLQVLVMPASTYWFYRTEDHWLHATRKEPEVRDQDFTDMPNFETTEDYRTNFDNMLRAQVPYIYDVSEIQTSEGTFYDPYRLARSDRLEPRGYQ